MQESRLLHIRPLYLPEMRDGLGFRDDIETLAQINNSSGSGNRILISGSPTFGLLALPT